jgi:asparagine synthase (glutamine-hydrolysing)
LEVRVPFLNRETVKFISDLPFDLKLHGMTSKFLLRKAIQHRLPPEILRRPKKGFNMPVAYWLNTDLRELLQEMLSTERIKRQGLFNPDYVTQLVEEHTAKKRDNRKQLWTLLMFQIWYEKYCKG